MNRVIQILAASVLLRLFQRSENDMPFSEKQKELYEKYIGKKETEGKRVAVVPKGNAVEVEVSKPETGGYTKVKIPKRGK